MAVVNSSTMDFRDVINDILTNYTADIVEITTDVIPKVAKEAATKLRKTSPVGATGKYGKGWTTTVEKGRLRVGATVHGKSGTYQLAHLLEHGHLMRNGLRSGQRVHIEPVEQWAIDEAYERIINRVEGKL